MKKEGHKYQELGKEEKKEENMKWLS